MTNDRAQGVADADRDIQQYLIRIAAVLGDTLGEQLAGLYVHGSLASGVFRRGRSDIDLLAVVRSRLDTAERAALARSIVRLSDARPLAGDLEINAISEQVARKFVHPMPYELHYSAPYHDAFESGTFDFARERTYRMLAAYVADVRAHGVTVFGPPAETMFGLVPWYAFIDSQYADFQWQREHHTLPSDTILALCRIAHATTSRDIAPQNKDEAARWALQSLPAEHHSTILDALNLYRGEKTPDDVVLRFDAIEALRSYVYEKAKPAFDRATDDEDDADDEDLA